MSQDRTPAFERLLDRAARAISGSGLHPLELLERVRQQYERAIRGEYAPNRVSLDLNPGDIERLGGDVGLVRESVLSTLEAENRRAGRRTSGPWLVEIDAIDSVPAGAPAIRVEYADVEMRPNRPASATPTRRLARHDGVSIVLTDGTRVPVSHTPFSIGRAPGNDLVIPSLSISRRHARLVRTETGFELIDLGSRNGIVVNGRRVERLALAPGIVAILGDVAVHLEAGG